MKKLAISAFVAAIITATPAYAQSSFVMIIGDLPEAKAEQASPSPVSQETLIERTVEDVCVRPSLRDLRATMEYRACAVEVRAAVLAQLEEDDALPRQLAAR